MDEGIELQSCSIKDFRCTKRSWCRVQEVVSNNNYGERQTFCW